MEQSPIPGNCWDRLETANGVLMFGVSTAMILGIMQHLFQTRFALPGSWGWMVVSGIPCAVTHRPIWKTQKGVGAQDEQE